MTIRRITIPQPPRTPEIRLPFTPQTLPIRRPALPRTELEEQTISRPTMPDFTRVKEVVTDRLSGFDFTSGWGQRINDGDIDNGGGEIWGGHDIRTDIGINENMAGYGSPFGGGATVTPNETEQFDIATILPFIVIGAIVLIIFAVAM